MSSYAAVSSTNRKPGLFCAAVAAAVALWNSGDVAFVMTSTPSAVTQQPGHTQPV